MKFHRSKKERSSVRLDMTPMIDVVFLLILFFMLASTFVVQSSINIKMAMAKGAVGYEQRDLTITLVYGEGGPGGKGPVYVNDVEIKDMEELARVLTEAHTERPDAMVLVRPDARIESARLIEVLGIANSVGIERYGIAAQPPTPAADHPNREDGK